MVRLTLLHPAVIHLVLCLPRIPDLPSDFADFIPSYSSNMLYPKEDRMTSKLMFACRTCQFSEEATSSCVFRNNLYNTVGETAGVTQDVGTDPTVGHTSLDMWPCCMLCGEVIEVALSESDNEGGGENRSKTVEERPASKVRSGKARL